MQFLVRPISALTAALLVLLPDASFSEPNEFDSVTSEPITSETITSESLASESIISESAASEPGLDETTEQVVGTVLEVALTPNPAGVTTGRSADLDQGDDPWLSGTKFFLVDDDFNSVEIPPELVGEATTGALVLAEVDEAGEVASVEVLEPGLDPEPSDVSQPEVAAAAVATAASTTRYIDLVIITPPDVSITASHETAARAMANQSAQYWNQVTGGAVQFNLATVAQAPERLTSCTSEIQSWVDAAPFANWSLPDVATWNSGIPIPNLRYLMVYIPAGCSNAPAIGWGLIGNPTSGGMFTVVPARDSAVGTNFDVTAHELGHNLGLRHAGALARIQPNGVGAPNNDCRVNIPLSTSGGGDRCIITEYADLFDLMGYSLQPGGRMISAPQALMLGVPIGVTAVPALLQGPSRFTLAPMSGLSGTRALSVLDPNTGETYWIELRANFGYDAGYPSGSYQWGLSNSTTPQWQRMSTTYGVKITKQISGQTGSLSSLNGGTVMVGPNTGSGSVYLDTAAAWASGNTFTSAGGGFTLRVDSITGTGAATRAQVTITRLDAANQPPGPFRDIWATTPFRTEIEWMLAAGITTGFADNTFRPTALVERQAMAAFIYRLAGSPEFPSPAHATFRDVPVGAPFFKEIEWMAATGITTGYSDGTFRPRGSVERQAMAAFIYRLAAHPAYGGGFDFTTPATATFVDTPVGSPFFREIEWMASTGITTGTKQANGTWTFNGRDLIRRDAMAAFTYRYVNVWLPTR